MVQEWLPQSQIKYGMFFSLVITHNGVSWLCSRGSSQGCFNSQWNFLLKMECLSDWIQFKNRPKERFLVWPKNLAKGRIPSLAISCFTAYCQPTRYSNGLMVYLLLRWTSWPQYSQSSKLPWTRKEYAAVEYRPSTTIQRSTERIKALHYSWDWADLPSGRPPSWEKALVLAASNSRLLVLVLTYATLTRR